MSTTNRCYQCFPDASNTDNRNTIRFLCINCIATAKPRTQQRVPETMNRCSYCSIVECLEETKNYPYCVTCVSNKVYRCYVDMEGFVSCTSRKLPFPALCFSCNYAIRNQKIKKQQKSIVPTKCAKCNGNARIQQVKKEGANTGKFFYCCNEKGCNFFKWL